MTLPRQGLSRWFISICILINLNLLESYTTRIVECYKETTAGWPAALLSL